MCLLFAKQIYYMVGEGVIFFSKHFESGNDLAVVVHAPHVGVLELLKQLLELLRYNLSSICISHVLMWCLWNL